MSESQEPQRSKNALIPCQPFPRPWKTEPDEEPDQAGIEPPRKGASKDDGEVSSKATGPVKSVGKEVGKTNLTKGSPGEGEKTEKKVLLEETPALDPYESRRWARVIVGGLSLACLLLMVWITYRIFLYDPSAVTVAAVDPSLGTVGRTAQAEVNEIRNLAIGEIRNLAIGQPAPEISGEDVDGKSFQLSDYTGKVVVVAFWGDW
jgi:hypothetical protein